MRIVLALGTATPKLLGEEWWQRRSRSGLQSQGLNLNSDLTMNNCGFYASHLTSETLCFWETLLLDDLIIPSWKMPSFTQSYTSCRLWITQSVYSIRRSADTELTLFYLYVSFECSRKHLMPVFFVYTMIANKKGIHLKNYTFSSSMITKK